MVTPKAATLARAKQVVAALDVGWEIAPGPAIQVVLDPTFHAPMVLTLIVDHDERMLSVDVPGETRGDQRTSESITLGIVEADRLVGAARATVEAPDRAEPNERDGLTVLVRMAAHGSVREAEDRSPDTGTSVRQLLDELLALGSRFESSRITGVFLDVGRYVDG